MLTAAMQSIAALSLTLKLRHDHRFRLDRHHEVLFEGPNGPKVPEAVARDGNQSIVDGNEWHGSEAGRSREWGQQLIVAGVPRRAFEHQQGNAHVVTI